MKFSGKMELDDKWKWQKNPQSLALSSDNIFFEVYSWGQGVIIVY